MAKTLLLNGRRLLEDAPNFDGVISVRVPLDIHAVSANGSGAFALATPVRVRDLVMLAVREAIGARAPQDKFMRSVRSTLSGLAGGRFFVDIDGRHFSSVDDVVMCGATARVRFFVPSRRTPVGHSQSAV